MHNDDDPQSGPRSSAEADSNESRHESTGVSPYSFRESTEDFVFGPLAITLRRIEKLTTVITLVNAILTVTPPVMILNLIIWYSGYRDIGLADYSQYLFLPIAGVVLCVSFFTALFHDLLRRRGEGMYTETSEWMAEAKHRIRTETIRNAGQPRSVVSVQEERLKTYDLQARVALRTFNMSVDPPLFPGRYGVAMIILINLVLFLVHLSLDARLA